MLVHAGWDPGTGVLVGPPRGLVVRDLPGLLHPTRPSDKQREPNHDPYDSACAKRLILELHVFFIWPAESLLVSHVLITINCNKTEKIVKTEWVFQMLERRARILNPVSSHSSHHPQKVLLVQYSLYVHKDVRKSHSFDFQKLHHLTCNTNSTLKLNEVNGFLKRRHN